MAVSLHFLEPLRLTLLGKLSLLLPCECTVPFEEIVFCLFVGLVRVLWDLIPNRVSQALFEKPMLHIADRASGY